MKSEMSSLFERNLPRLPWQVALKHAKQVPGFSLRARGLKPTALPRRPFRRLTRGATFLRRAHRRVKWQDILYTV